LETSRGDNPKGPDDFGLKYWFLIQGVPSLLPGQIYVWIKKRNLYHYY
jgi:hypothetical protein